MMVLHVPATIPPAVCSPTSPQSERYLLTFWLQIISNAMKFESGSSEQYKRTQSSLLSKYATWTSLVSGMILLYSPATKLGLILYTGGAPLSSAPIFTSCPKILAFASTLCSIARSTVSYVRSCMSWTGSWNMTRIQLSYLIWNSQVKQKNDLKEIKKWHSSSRHIREKQKAQTWAFMAGL